MKILEDDSPSLEDLVQDAMSRLRRNEEYSRSRKRHPYKFYSEEQIEQVINELNEIIATKEPFWLETSKIKIIEQTSYNNLDFQKRCNEEFTKKGENLEFFWVFKDGISNNYN